METLLRRYPNLGPARILDALSFAYDNLDLLEADMAREQALFDKQGGPSVGARPLAQLSLPFDEEEQPVPAKGTQLVMPGVTPKAPETKPIAAPTKTTRKR